MMAPVNPISSHIIEKIISFWASGTKPSFCMLLPMPLPKVTSTPKQLVFLLTDKGASFDPTQVEDTDITLSLEERPIGGLGIFLIRSIMNEISYQRLDNENRLTMKKDI